MHEIFKQNFTNILHYRETDFQRGPAAAVVFAEEPDLEKLKTNVLNLEYQSFFAPISVPESFRAPRPRE
jgi:hypothetical protein